MLYNNTPSYLHHEFIQSREPKQYRQLIIRVIKQYTSIVDDRGGSSFGLSAGPCDEHLPCHNLKLWLNVRDHFTYVWNAKGVV